MRLILKSASENEEAKYQVSYLFRTVDAIAELVIILMIMKRNAPVPLMAKIINHDDGARRDESRTFPVGNYYERTCDTAIFHR